MMGKTTQNLSQRTNRTFSARLLCSLLLLGWPAAPAAWAQLGAPEPELCSFDSDIVVMIDVSGSIEDDVLANVVDGVRGLLAHFASNNPRPRVAIGVFSGIGQIIEGAGLTDDYATAGSGPLYTALSAACPALAQAAHVYIRVWLLLNSSWMSTVSLTRRITSSSFPTAAVISLSSRQLFTFATRSLQRALSSTPFRFLVWTLIASGRMSLCETRLPAARSIIMRAAQNPLACLRQ